MVSGDGGDGESGLTPEACKQLLLTTEEDSEPSLEVTADSAGVEGPCLMVGYPDAPLYERISDCMSYWLITGYVASQELPE